MKRLLIFLIICFSAPVPGDSAILPSRAEKMAVYIEKSNFKGLEEFNSQNLQNCVTNHLEYLLWRKGWDFRFISSNKKNSFRKLTGHAKSEGFDYLLYLRPKAVFQAGEGKSDEEKKSARYPAEYPTLKISLSLFYADLTDSLGKIDSFHLSAQTLDDWFVLGDSTIVSWQMTRPEPPEYTIMRILSQGTEFLPAKERKPLSYNDSIPFYLVVDSRILNDRRGGTDSIISEAVEYASYSLASQFNLGLYLCAKTYFTTPKVPLSDIGRLFESFLKSEFPKPDTIIVCVFRPQNLNEYFLDANNIRVGVSDIGRKTSVIAEMHPPSPLSSEWGSFLNGQLILHEIGHLLGSIHVFDIGSAMTEKRSWVASNRFDSLNSHIVRKGREDKARLASLKNYAFSLTEAIETVNYKLSNYPAVFASLIHADKAELDSANFGTSNFAKSIHAAAKGYEYFLEGKKDMARESLNLGLAGDSAQAAIHYYLSQLTEGKLSEYHLNKALKVGLYVPYEERVLHRDGKQ